jgi:GNAT superfamily N-acetyltransferase
MPVMDVRIRPLEARDREAWEPLFQGYLTFYKSSLTDEQIDVTFERLLSDDPQFHIGLVAVDEADKPIGLAHVLFHRSTWSPTYYCYLEDLFVDPDCRAKGIGEKLIEAVYAEADKRQCTRTYWATQEFNYRARGLYDKVATKSPFLQYRR